MLPMKKRSREDSEIAMANCLMLLSKIDGESDSTSSSYGGDRRMFTCKTCNKQFQSFQALGGHRASHKKLLQEPSSPKKAKTTHECSICGLEFPIGQALGGHMRRHRGESEGLVTQSLLPAAVMSSPAVMKKSSSFRSKRVWGLDLNLALFDCDLKLKLFH